MNGLHLKERKESAETEECGLSLSEILKTNHCKSKGLIEKGDWPFFNPILGIVCFMPQSRMYTVI